jgi:hypothetical protein
MNEKIKHNGKGKTETAALCDQGISRWISRSWCADDAVMRRLRRRVDPGLIATVRESPQFVQEPP